MSLFSLSPEATTRWSIAKGLIFVGITSTLVYLILQKLNKANKNLELTIATRTSALAASEQDLRGSEERLRMLLANLPDVTWTSAEDGRTIYVSPNVERVIGYTAEEICEKSEELWFQRIEPAHAKRLKEAFRSLFEDGQALDVEYRIQRKDGCWIWLRDRATRTHMENGVKYADGSLTDITVRKHSEEALHRYELLAGHTRDIVLFVRQDDGRILDANAAATAAYGYAAEELLSLTVYDLRALDAVGLLHSQVLEADTRGALFETVERRKDGSTFPAEVSLQRANIEGTRTLISVIRDITERKRANEALVKSEAHFRSLFENMLHGFAYCKMLFDEQGRPDDFEYLDVNKAFGELSGLRDVVGKKASEVIPGILESQPRLIELYGRVASTGQPERFEIDLGRLGVWSVSAYSPERWHVVTIFDNITQQRLAALALRESENRFRGVVEGAAEGIFMQTEGLIRYLNPAAVALFGAESPEQLVGQPFIERFHSDHRTRMEESFRRIREGESEAEAPHEERYLRLDGAAFDVEVTAIPFNFEGSAGAIVFFRDITDRNRSLLEMRKLEQQLRQATKMEAVGRLAGGIAHDFNNLLMVISSYAEMLQDSLPVDDRLRRNTEEIVKATERAARLTGQLLAFSRKQIIAPVVIDLNVVVDETTTMLKRVIGEDIELAVKPEHSLWQTRSDPDQIVQVLMNLCVNARDAMPQGGTLTITTNNLSVEEGSAGASPFVAVGDYVVLSVTDTGEGMSKQVQEQIFEPFFTTKGNRGTGLGLSTIYGITKQSNGYVLVESELGQGSCFTVYLPRTKDEPVETPRATTEPVRGGTETLLIVEDEAALRESIREFLSSLGYTVLTAGSGRHALSIARGQERVDVLITDVVMPKMNGRELSQSLARLHPEVKTIYMSGYTDDEVLRHGISDEGVAFLQKPISMATVARKVREVLRNSP